MMILESQSAGISCHIVASSLRRRVRLLRLCVQGFTETRLETDAEGPTRAGGLGLMGPAAAAAAGSQSGPEPQGTAARAGWPGPGPGSSGEVTLCD
jgi:hypothetical protein